MYMGCLLKEFILCGCLSLFKLCQLALAVICGTILSLAIFFLAPAFLTSFTGAGAGEVLVGAKEFAKIRALGTPAAILTMVAQVDFFFFKLLSGRVSVLLELTYR